MLPFNKNLKSFARNLRSNMTDAEQLVWSKIRRKQIGDVQFNCVVEKIEEYLKCLDT